MERRTFIRRALLAALLTIGAPGLVRGEVGRVDGGSLRVWSIAAGGYIMVDKVRKSTDEWRRQLTPQQFHVIREKGTERAFTGQYWNSHADGIYRCVGCGQDLFDSRAKFDSGTGWPSYTEPVAAEIGRAHV